MKSTQPIIDRTPEIQNPKSKIQNPKSKIQNLIWAFPSRLTSRKNSYIITQRQRKSLSLIFFHNTQKEVKSWNAICMQEKDSAAACACRSLRKKSSMKSSKFTNFAWKRKLAKSRISTDKTKPIPLPPPLLFGPVILMGLFFSPCPRPDGTFRPD